MKRNVVLILAVCICVASSYGMTVLDSNYQVESYASYYFGGIGNMKYICADDSGNLYVTHDGSPNGSIMQMSGDGVATSLSSFVTGGNNFQSVVSGHGTVFGDNLYVAEVYSNRVISADTSGSTEVFSVLPSQPIAIGLDKTGNYGGNMFVSTRSTNEIYKVDENGTSSLFIDWPATGNGWVTDIEFDTTGNYGGLMYISSLNTSNTDTMGIFSVDDQGNATRFLREGFGYHDMAFDTTDSEAFGGYLYTGAGSKILQIGFDGSETEFILSENEDLIIWDLTFGPDDAMYVLSSPQSLDQVNITKITAIPEPCSIALLALGGLILRRRKNA